MEEWITWFGNDYIIIVTPKERIIFNLGGLFETEQDIYLLEDAVLIKISALPKFHHNSKLQTAKTASQIEKELI